MKGLRFQIGKKSYKNINTYSKERMKTFEHEVRDRKNVFRKTNLKKLH